MVITIKKASVIAQPSTKVEPKMDMEIINWLII